MSRAYCRFLHIFRFYVIVHVAMFGSSLYDKQTHYDIVCATSDFKMNKLSGATESPTRSSSPGHSSHGGDYSTRMEELFDSDEDEHGGDSGDEQEEFLYDGMDAEQVTGTNYREQLRDVLGPDDTSDVFEEAEVERSLLKEDPSEKFGDADTGEPSVSTSYDLVLMGCG